MSDIVRSVDGHPVRVCPVSTLVIGSGAAALKAAVSLHALGQRDLIVVTEGCGQGTSANAGSDKQTYYRLPVSGDTEDSPRRMAEDLFAGGCMHGDIALAEAQHSAQAFYHLVALGIPFPHDAYGGFPGYRTDHDRRGRGTSAGPLTSKLMVEALGREARERGIPILNGYQVVGLLVDRRDADSRIAGAIALEPGETGEPAVVVFNARSVVFGTGGPGAMYADSVYPPEQVGAIGMALAIGAVAQNLTESQFGLASTSFRWNVSGSYQQVVPRYLSTDAMGRDEHDFLSDVFPSMRSLATAIFRKGYQWPFDARQVAGFGSSLIDLLVYRERTIRGRRVFLDYTRNPDGGRRLGPFALDDLGPDELGYLRKSGATAGSPFERLQRLNPPAIDLYARHGIDLSRHRLEIAVCAQHNNGGLKGNRWWESNVRGLFPVGEVNGSHGVYRPGGAALNAGQVGALRAAMFIARRCAAPPPALEEFLAATEDQIRATLRFAGRTLSAAPSERRRPAHVRAEIQSRMTRAGAHVRSAERVREALTDAWALYHELRDCSVAQDLQELRDAFRNLDMSLAHALYLDSIAEYLARGGRSRGSCLVLDPSGELACEGLGDRWRYSLNLAGAFVDRHVLEISFTPDRDVVKEWAAVRPIPRTDTWFESVWKAYRDDEVIR